MDAVILAAGYGKRLGKLTENVPKTLLKIKGQEPILDRLIETLQRATISNIYIMTGFQEEKLKKHVEESKFSDITVLTARNYEKGPLFTFSEVRKIGLKENFLLLPSDIIIQDEFLNKFIREHKDGEFSIPYTRNGELDKNNTLFISEEYSEVVGFNKLIRRRPNHIKVTPIPTIILNSSIFSFVDVAIKLKCTRVIHALNFAIEFNTFIRPLDYSDVNWVDVDTKEIYNGIK